MNTPGIAVSRWIDGVLEDKENVQQKDNLRAPCSSRAMPEQPDPRPGDEEGAGEGRAAGGLDPFPTHLAVMSDRKNNTYLLPTCTQFEQEGSITSSNRSMQWREQVIEPLVRVTSAMPRSCTCSRRSSALPTRCSRTSRSRTTSRIRRTRCARSTAACGPSVTAAEPGAPEAACAASRHLQHDDAEGRGRSLRRRHLRPAVALLGHAGDEAPGHARALHPEQARQGRRPVFPRATSDSSIAARRCWPRVPGRRARISPKAIRPSRRTCSSSSAGGMS
jgi:hypothetical protein